jgi:uncharacterized protein with FMN-binding domain
VKRISYWVLSTVSAFVLLLGFDASHRGSAVTATTATISGGSSGTSSGGSSSSSSGSSGGNGNGNGSGNNSGSSSTNGSGTNGSSNNSSGTSGKATTKPTTATVTGSAAQTMWGPVQVQLSVTDKKITKVAILQYPNGNGRDVEIANYSFPILINETIKNQSANIDMVSGATYTSTGYVQSLQSAIDQANL